MAFFYLTIILGLLCLLGLYVPKASSQLSIQGLPQSSTSTPLQGNKQPINGNNLSPYGPTIQMLGSIEEKFQVNKNSIIRTHDSRTMGAKYLNETDLASNEDCLQWCWNTSTCNLAVYEEKTRGSCYLFDCGPLDDFKCRFTAHSFYTSSVLKVNRNSYFLSEWKSQASQESELTGLKSKSQQFQSHMKMNVESALNKGSQTEQVKLMSTTTIPTKISRCLHYQFECRNNSDCIAIYNVCDGIPQCADGSDEAIELECHKSRVNLSTVKLPSTDSDLSNNKVEQPKYPSLQKSVSSQANSFGGGSNVAASTYDIGNIKLQPDLMGNEQQNKPGSKYNYPHSANEKNPDESALYQGRANWQLGGDYAVNVNGGYALPPWGQYSMPSDSIYSKPDKISSYIAEPEQQYGNQLKEPVYWPSFNYQQTNSKAQPMAHPNILDLHQSPEFNSERTLSLPETRNWQVDNNNYQQNVALQQTHSQSTQPLLYNRYFGNSVQAFKSNSYIGSDNGTKSGQPTDLGSATNTGQTINQVNSNNNNTNTATKVEHHYSHLSTSQKKVSVWGPSIVAASYLRDSSPQNGRETNSAVIALTLGLFITCLLVVIVGCRMKSFKKRIARRGRSLTHDADYLVNGMYL